MTFLGDDRAQSVQVGAVLLFGFLVVAMAGYQAQVVPAENKEVEYRHSERVQSQLVDLRSAVVAAASGDGAPVSVALGTRYPDRTLFVNPPPPTGHLETVRPGGGELRLGNVTAASPDAADFWTGGRAVATRALAYRPDYNVFAGAPTAVVVANSVVSARYADANLTRTDQRLVHGNRISLVALNGSLDSAGVGSVAVDPRPVSAATRTVTLSNTSAGPPTLRVPTALPASVWRDLLAAQIDDSPDAGADDRYVTSVTNVAGSDAVRLVFENATYTLRMAKVGVGTAVSGVEAAYAVPVDGDGEALVENSTQQVTVEVRDRFNNPVAGVDVNATLVGPAGGRIGPTPGDRNRTNLTTDAEGRVTLTYRAPADLTGTDTAAATVRFGFGNGTAALRGSGYDPRGPANVSVNLTVENADGSGVSGPGAGINPNGDGAVVLRGAGISSSGCALGTTCRVNVFLENTASSGTRTIERARFNFYDVDNQPGTGNANQRSPPSTVEFFNTTSGTATLRSASSGGAFEAVEATVPASQSAVGVRLQFSAANGDPFEVLQGDFFVMSVVFEDGATATYFVAPVDNPNVNPGPGNAAPTADAGGPYTVSEGATVGLDATGSSDPDGDSLSYSWAITGDDYGASIQNPDTATPTFDASGASVSQNRDVTVEVTVTDGNGGSATDTATATIQDGGSSGVAANVEVAQVQVDNGDVVVQFRNDNPTSVTVQRARLDSYTEANTPNDVEPIDRVVYRPGVGGPELVGGDGLEPVGGPTLSNGANQDVTLQPRRDTNTRPGTGNRNIEDADAQPGDTLSISVEFGDGSTRTYDITL